MGTPVIVKVGGLKLLIHPPMDSRVGSDVVAFFKVVNLTKTSIRFLYHGYTEKNSMVRVRESFYSPRNFRVYRGTSRNIVFYTYDLAKNRNIVGSYIRITIFRDSSGRLSYTITKGRLVDLVTRGEIDCTHMW